MTPGHNTADVSQRTLEMFAECLQVYLYVLAVGWFFMVGQAYFVCAVFLYLRVNRVYLAEGLLSCWGLGNTKIRIIHKCLSELIQAASGRACLKSDHCSWLGSISVFCCLDCETVQVGLIKAEQDALFDWTCFDFDSLLCKLLQGWQIGSFYWQLPAGVPHPQEVHFRINGSLFLSLS